MQNFKSSKMARNTIGTISLLLACADASALGQVSRSCRFSEIPFGLQNISARFFRAVGAPASILSLPALSSSEQAKYRIFESITTDYLRFRYLLFAMSWTFRRVSR
jgi:hypothetical protein